MSVSVMTISASSRRQAADLCKGHQSNVVTGDGIVFVEFRQRPLLVSWTEALNVTAITFLHRGSIIRINRESFLDRIERIP